MKKYLKSLFVPVILFSFALVGISNVAIANGPTGDNMQKYIANGIGPVIELLINNDGGENDGTIGIGVKTTAQPKWCKDDRGQNYQCGWEECNETFQQNVGGVTVTCELNCDGVTPNGNGVCDCPFAIDPATELPDCTRN